MFTRKELAWLLACAALAVGEGLAAAFPRGAEAWAYPLLPATFIVLFGYGWACRGWQFLAIALVGLSLGWQSTVVRERELRETPWLRNARRVQPLICSSPLVRDLSRRIGLGLDSVPDIADLNRAILLGEKSRMDPATRRAFVEAGAIHVFAVSGLHVMVVARLLMFFAALCFVPCRWQGAVTLPVVWFYVHLIGAPPSAVRAALMVSVYFGAPVAWRRPNGLMAWALAFLTVHTVRPQQIAEVGSQLSFAVMLALVVTGRLTRRWADGWRKTLALGGGAWAASLPICAAVFGQVTPGGLVANFVLVGAAGFSVAAGAIGVLTSCVSERLAAHANNLAALMTTAMVCLAETIAAIPFASFRLPPWGAAECAEWVLALLLTLYLIRPKRDML